MKYMITSFVVIITFMLLPFVAHIKANTVVVINEDPEPSPIRVIIKKKPLTIKEYIKTKDWNHKLAYAVMMSESRGKATARNINKGGSVDVGYWQINNKYHPHITTDCAKDIKCSTDYVYTLYIQAGRKFTPWYGYKNGSYKEFML